MKIFLILAELVIAPIIVSRILVYTKLDTPILPYKGLITNWGFFIVVYTIIGLNRTVFFKDPAFILPLLIICFLSTFILGSIIGIACRIFNIGAKRCTSLNLLGTMKNSGTAAGIGLLLFGKTAALPAAVATIFMIVYFIWLGLKQKWQKKRTLS
jgi:ACR3 family arsenite efflux pump ArsB